MSEPAGALARIPGQLGGDERVAAATASVRGELVAPAEEFVDAFVTTLVASPQTQRTYQRACRRFVAWLGPLAGPEALSSEQRQEQVVQQRDRGRVTLDDDRDAA